MDDIKLPPEERASRSLGELDGLRMAAELDFYEAILAGARFTGASKRLSMHDIRHMSLAVRERIVAAQRRVETGCCACSDGWVERDATPRDQQWAVIGLERVHEQCRCSCHTRETTRIEDPTP